MDVQLNSGHHLHSPCSQKFSQKIQKNPHGYILRLTTAKILWMGKADIVINMVCRKALFDSTIINTPKQFAEFANILDTISCLSLPNRARSCQWMHSHTWHHLNAVQTYRSHGVQCNRFLLDFQKRAPFWARVRFFLRSQRKWRWLQHMLPFSERVYRFATNGFTKSAFTFDRIADYF